jgi:D-threonate/D-erythronate kinase
VNVSLAIVADDLTGAADAGIGFRRAGLSTTVVWIGENVPALSPVGADVLAIDTGTRALSAPEAVERTALVVARVKSFGVPRLYKKIDSTLRGHIGPELGVALSSWRPWALAIVAPAFPAMQRTTTGGEQYASGSALRAGPLMRPLEHAGLRTDHADVGRVRGGSLGLAFADARARGVQAVVCDAETDTDLRAIARAGATLGSDVLWVGSGGLASVLPEALQLQGAGQVRTLPSAVSGFADRPVLIVVGSRAGASRDQVRALADAGGEVLTVGTDVLAAGSRDVAIRFVSDVHTRLQAGHDVVVSIGGGDAAAEDPRLTRALGELLRSVLPAVGGLVLTGGDTAIGVLGAFGVTALELVDEVEAGIPLSWSVGAIALPVVTKAGGFGGPNALRHSRDCLRSTR